MSPRSLKFKVSLYLTTVLVAVMVLFVVLLVQQERGEQLRTLVTHMTQLSQVIARSTRYAMLLDEPDIVDKIIEDIGKQEGIQRVRVLRKNGVIAHSNYPAEIGQNIDKEAEHCSYCHEGDKALTDIPNHKKWRLFETADRQPDARQHGGDPQRAVLLQRASATSIRPASRCSAWSTSPIRWTRSTGP